MNKRLLTILTNIMFIYMISYLIIIVMIGKLSNLETSQILIITVFILVILIFGIAIKSILILYDEKFLPKVTPRERDFLIYIVFNFISIISVKFFYLSFSTINLSFQINVFILINSCFLLIPLYILLRDYWDRYQKDHFEVILELKQRVIQYAIIGPIVTVFSIFFMLYVLPINIKTKLNIMLILVPILFGTLIVYFYLDNRYKVLSILVTKYSQNEETKKYIEEFYKDPLKVEEYLNSNLRIATLITIINTIIIVPVSLMFLILNKPI